MMIYNFKLFSITRDNKTMETTYEYIKTKHSWHLIDPSPWPILTSTGAFITTTGLVMYMHSYQNGWFVLFNGLIILLSSTYMWWRDVVREATFEEQHTYSVQRGLRLGMILFIVSEIMFFFAFFWGFFHSSLSPTFDIGGTWPPKQIITLDLWGAPFVNTLILLSSGVAVTWTHHSIIARDKTHSMYSLALALKLAIMFTALQVCEYEEAVFSINDGVYGSCFYLTTGFHGFHVVIGTIFLSVAFIRIALDHFTNNHHFGFEAGAWYWHFVDVVWLFLFVVVYWWGNQIN